MIHTRRPQTDDAGAALVLVLVLMVIGALVVAAVLSFAQTSFKVGGVTAPRNRAAKSAEGVARMAIARQKALGAAAGCLTMDDEHTNGYTISVACTSTTEQRPSSPGVYSIITTNLTATGASISANASPTLTGDVFLSGGQVGGFKTVTPFNLSLDSAGAFGVGASAKSCSDAAVMSAVTVTGHGPIDCTGDHWLARQGALNPWDGSRMLVTLPSIPADQRTGAAFTIGTCNIYLPGRYHGLAIGAGEHYFASGTYYFDGPVTVGDDARVVGGAGPTPGCAIDSVLALDPAAPLSPRISGKGALFVLGGAATFSLHGSNISFVLNRRQPGTIDNWTAKDVSIVAVTGDHEDIDYVTSELWVGQENGGWHLVSEHGIPDDSPTPIARYAVSTVAPTSDIISIDAAGASTVDIGGTVYAPSAGVTVGQAASTTTVKLGNGLVANHVTLSVADKNTFVVGAATTNSTVTIFKLVTTTSGGGSRPTSSTAFVEFNEYGDNSVRSWIDS